MKDLVTIIGPSGRMRQVLRSVAMSEEVAALGYRLLEDVIPQAPPAIGYKVKAADPVAPVVPVTPAEAKEETPAPTVRRRIKTTDDAS